MDRQYLVQHWQGDEGSLARYASLLSQVFGHPVSHDFMIWKHARSPLGPSLITYIEDDQRDWVAARAFWPMFCEKGRLYQPCDTVTRSDYQRKGLFSKLTKACVDALGEDVGIINFPNNNSFPAYLKLGWELLAPNRKVFSVHLPIGFKPVENLRAAIEGMASDAFTDYLCWRFDQHGDYRFYLKGHTLLVCKSDQSAALSLVSGLQPQIGGPGYSTGYVLDSAGTARVSATGLNIDLACQSRTAALVRSSAAKTLIEEALMHNQVNALMDTF